MLNQTPCKFWMGCIQTVLLILSIGVILGCEPAEQGRESTDLGITPAPADAMVVEATTSPADSANPALVLPVLPLEGVEKLAVVVFFRDGAQTRIIATDTPPTYATVEPMNIYKGTCGQLGGAVHALKGILDGHSTTMLNIAMDKLYGGKYAVNIHESVARIENSLACAAIPEEADTTVMVLHSQGSDNPAGYAGLVAIAGTTRIAVKLNSPASKAQPSAALVAGGCFGNDDGAQGLSKVVDGLSITDVNISFEQLLSNEFSIVLRDENLDGPDYLSCGTFRPSA